MPARPRTRHNVTDAQGARQQIGALSSLSGRLEHTAPTTIHPPTFWVMAGPPSRPSIFLEPEMTEHTAFVPQSQYDKAELVMREWAALWLGQRAVAGRQNVDGRSDYTHQLRWWSMAREADSSRPVVFIISRDPVMPGCLGSMPCGN